MNTDIVSIRALIAAQFKALQWQSGGIPDYAPLFEGFVAEARLFPARRPLVSQSPREFCDRLDRLRQTGVLVQFEERMLGIDVQIFGHVAVALVGCEMVENGDTVTRDVSGFLLLKDDGEWRIAAQGWDFERDGLALPETLARAQPLFGA